MSLFAAALIFSCSTCEISIYSTCKRISQKLLRNVLRYLNILFDALKIPKYKTVRENQEEIILNGPDGIQDIRVVNSYPSKVRFPPIPQPQFALHALVTVGGMRVCGLWCVGMLCGVVYGRWRRGSCGMVFLFNQNHKSSHVKYRKFERQGQYL